jgi:putative transposase
MLDSASLQFLLAISAGIVHRHQQRVNDFLVEENKILKGALGGKRARFDDDRRRRLAILGKALGRVLLEKFASIVTPETILR